MSDTETTTTTTVAGALPPLPPRESLSTTPTPEPSDYTSFTTIESKPLDSQIKTDDESKKSSGISLRIWPPSQRTRDAVVTRLIETLVNPSILSKRYGEIPQDEASVAAHRIEEEAFGVASATTSDEDYGIEILQVYSKEISKRMLESVKARASAAAAATTRDIATLDTNGSQQVDNAGLTGDASVASVEAEA